VYSHSVRAAIFPSCSTQRKYKSNKSKPAAASKKVGTEKRMDYLLPFTIAWPLSSIRESLDSIDSTLHSLKYSFQDAARPSAYYKAKCMAMTIFVFLALSMPKELRSPTFKTALVSYTVCASIFNLDLHYDVFNLLYEFSTGSVKMGVMFLLSPKMLSWLYILIGGFIGGNMLHAIFGKAVTEWIRLPLTMRSTQHLEAEGTSKKGM